MNVLRCCLVIQNKGSAVFTRFINAVFWYLNRDVPYWWLNYFGERCWGTYRLKLVLKLTAAYGLNINGKSVRQCELNSGLNYWWDGYLKKKKHWIFWLTEQVLRFFKPELETELHIQMHRSMGFSLSGVVKKFHVYFLVIKFKIVTWWVTWQPALGDGHSWYKKCIVLHWTSSWQSHEACKFALSRDLIVVCAI